MSPTRIFIAGALLLSWALPAQAQGARVYGSVTDQEGNALAGTSVTFTDPAGAYNTRTLETNDKGDVRKFHRMYRIEAGAATPIPDATPGARQ